MDSQMLAGQWRIQQPHIRTIFREIRSLLQRHALRHQEQVRENEDVPPLMYDLYASRPWYKGDRAVRGRKHFASESKCRGIHLQHHGLKVERLDTDDISAYEHDTYLWLHSKDVQTAARFQASLKVGQRRRNCRGRSTSSRANI
jgi:hypothetical protein